MRTGKGEPPLEGVVTSVRSAGNSADNTYTIIADSAYVVKSALVLDLLDTVRASAESLKAGQLTAENCEILTKATADKTASAIKRMMKEVAKRMPKKIPASGIPKELKAVAGTMDKALGDTAAELMRRIVSGAPVVIRFHNDCDGSSGALGLHLALEQLRESCSMPEQNVSWRMNKSIAYTQESFSEDAFLFGAFRSVEKPMVLIIDFGTAEESDVQIRATEGKFDIAILDHHPVFDGFPKERLFGYINPWLFGGNSDCTAGFLACLFAQRIGKVEGIEEIMMASLIGDFSRHGDRSRTYPDRLAIVLDYLTSLDGRQGSPMPKVVPKSIASFIEDKERLDETYSRAITLLNESLERGERNAKRYRIKEAEVYAVDFSDAASPDSSYPLPGRFSSRLHERFEEPSKKAITIVYYGSFISVRMSRSLLGTVDLLGLMANLKQESEDVYSFGGHECAFGIKSDKAHLGKVVKLLLRRLGADA